MFPPPPPVWSVKKGTIGIVPSVQNSNATNRPSALIDHVWCPNPSTPCSGSVSAWVTSRVDRGGGGDGRRRRRRRESAESETLDSRTATTRSTASLRTG
jgi:hypothetical protein